jgi:hypothetical protein
VKRFAQKTFFRILIISAVLFCYGLGLNSGEFTNPFSMQYTESAGNITDRVISEIDLISDDQLQQTGFNTISLDPIMRIPISQDAFLFHNCFDPIWQPPKI